MTGMLEQRNITKYRVEIIRDTLSLLLTCSIYSTPDIVTFIPQLDGNHSSLSSSFHSSSEQSCISSKLSSSVQSFNEDNCFENSWFSPWIQLVQCMARPEIHSHLQTCSFYLIQKKNDMWILQGISWYMYFSGT